MFQRCAAVATGPANRAGKKLGNELDPSPPEEPRRPNPTKAHGLEVVGTDSADEIAAQLAMRRRKGARRPAASN